MNISQATIKKIRKKILQQKKEEQGSSSKNLEYTVEEKNNE